MSHVLTSIISPERVILSSPTLGQNFYSQHHFKNKKGLYRKGGKYKTGYRKRNDLTVESFPQNVERLNEHSLPDCLGRTRATAIYIIGGWVCHGFNTPPQNQYSFLLKLEIYLGYTQSNLISLKLT
jgi:hypothetical protein